MDRTKLVTVAAALFFTTAIALPALTGGVAAVQANETEQVHESTQPTRIDSCTVVTEPGVYELSPSFVVADEAVVDDGTLAGNATENETGITFDDETPSPTATDSPTATPAGNGTNDTAGNATLEDRSVTETDACILIAANDVVFDGNGTVLDGSNVTVANASVGDAAAGNDTSDVNASVANLSGIAVRPAPGETQVSNVTVRNVTVRNWYVGVSFQNVSNASLDGVTLRNNTVPGVRFTDASDATINASGSTET